MIGAKSNYLPPYREKFINLHGGIQQKHGDLLTYMEGFKCILEHQKGANPQKSVKLPTYLRYTVYQTVFLLAPWVFGCLFYPFGEIKIFLNRKT